MGNKRECVVNRWFLCFGKPLKGTKGKYYYIVELETLDQTHQFVFQFFLLFFSGLFFSSIVCCIALRCLVCYHFLQVFHAFQKFIRL